MGLQQRKQTNESRPGRVRANRHDLISAVFQCPACGAEPMRLITSSNGQGLWPPGGEAKFRVATGGRSRFNGERGAAPGRSHTRATG